VRAIFGILRLSTILGDIKFAVAPESIKEVILSALFLGWIWTVRSGVGWSMLICTVSKSNPKSLVDLRAVVIDLILFPIPTLPISPLPPLSFPSLL
jgi:hypothetical protein